MEKQCTPYLCGGVFFLLLTEAKGKPASRRQLQSGLKDRVSNKNILEALIQLIMPSFQQPSVGKTFEGDTSDYRACKVSRGLNLPFDDDTEIDGFDNRVKSQYQNVVHQMDALIDNFLRTDSAEKMRWLIQAILTLISEDHSITDDTLFYLSESPISKKELLTLDQYCLSSLLLAVWHYIVVNRPDNEKGRATFEQFHEHADEVGARWKFISPIGKTYPKQIKFDLFSVKSEEMHEENSSHSAKHTDYSEPTVEVYEAPVTDPVTGDRILAQFHVEASNGGIAAGIVYGGINIGDRRKKNDE